MKTHSAPAPENLSHAAAIEKIRQLAQSARVCFFGTSAGSLPLDVHPMTVQEVDDAGNVWFLSARSSTTNRHLGQNPRAQLLFANPSNSSYLNLLGTATVSDSPALRKKYWSALAKGWFPGGVDDPELTVLQVRVEQGHYWDTEHGKTITLLKIAVSALTGKQPNAGVQGEVKP